MTENGVSAKKGGSREMLLPDSLHKPMPDSMTCFCAAAVFRIYKGEIQFAYVPYRRDGAGVQKEKLAGGMGKKGESPIQTVKREVEEELGILLNEEDFHFVFVTSPLSDFNHKKIFFAVPKEIKKPLRDTAYDAETGVPQWVSPEWLKINLFGVHKEVFPKAIDFLVRNFTEQKNLKSLLAAVKSGLLELDDKVKGLLLQGAMRDQRFALAHAEELEAIGVGGNE